VGDIIGPGNVDQASPDSRLASASWRWWVVNLGLRPITTPLALARSLPSLMRDQLPFELGQTIQDYQHEPTVRRGGIGLTVPQRLEAGAVVNDRPQHVERCASTAPGDLIG
jgi:hypothetical protein